MKPIISFVRALVGQLGDPEFRVILGMLVGLLLLGTVVYVVIEGWTILEAVYFCVVTLATVGYGDLTPTTDLGRAFTIVFILSGIGLVVGFASRVVNAMVSDRERRLRERGPMPAFAGLAHRGAPSPESASPSTSRPAADSWHASTMDRDEQLERYRTGYADVEGALAGATDEDLDRVPADGGWSARMVAHHLADSETNAYVRLRRLIAEDKPVIIGYDEELWAHRLRYDLPIEHSLAVLAAVRGASLQLLDTLGDADFERAGVHSESGRYGVDDWLRIYSEHSHDHADQIRRARSGS